MEINKKEKKPLISLNKRILREIEKGYLSKEFEFLFDDNMKYNESESCYLKFKVKEGFF